MYLEVSLRDPAKISATGGDRIAELVPAIVALQSASPRATKPLSEEEHERVQIEAFVRGDMAGFKFVYNRHRQQVYSYCLYYMGAKVAAEDAFQEVFTRIYTHREQLREPKALKSWVLMITRSVCLNSLRTSKFTPEFVAIDGDFGGEHEMPVHKELTVDGRESQSTNDLLQLALSKLAPIYREAFLLREFEGYSYEEMAEATGITVLNVKVRITRAKKQLRTLLGPYFGNTQSDSSKSDQRAATASITTDAGNSELELAEEGEESFMMRSVRAKSLHASQEDDDEEGFNV